MNVLFIKLWYSLLHLVFQTISFIIFLSHTKPDRPWTQRDLCKYILFCLLLHNSQVIMFTYSLIQQFNIQMHISLLHISVFTLDQVLSVVTSLQLKAKFCSHNVRDQRRKVMGGSQKSGSPIDKDRQFFKQARYCCQPDTVTEKEGTRLTIRVCFAAAGIRVSACSPNTVMKQSCP